MKRMIMTFGLLTMAFFVLVPRADASEYYYPSLGYQYQYQPVYTPINYAHTPNYGYDSTLSQDQLIQYLRVLIAQLQAQLSGYQDYNRYGYGYGYNYVIGSPRSSDDDNDNYNDDEPDVETRSATDIEADEARLRGYVDMNDFEDGEVFFVFGTDEDQVNDVADDYDSYSDIDTDGEELRKVRVDYSLDGSSSYDVRVSGLDDDTRYYFAMCVGYEDEDEDDVITCDSSDDFRTDN